MHEHPASSDSTQPRAERDGFPPELALPRTLGDFELRREIGRGGMGVVFEARQISLNRTVALKVLPQSLVLEPLAVSRFEREAQAAARLHHVNIVPVYAIGAAAGHHYYAMELLDGEPLSRLVDRLRGGSADPLIGETWARTTDEASERSGEDSRGGSSSGRSDTSASGRAWFDAVARHVAAVADALQYAHAQGVVHRDVKPSNLILRRDGPLCLTDFGLARVGAEPGLTLSGAVLGTPAYMSPEQVAVGRVSVDHRTDVYSLGAVLYEMLTLHRPFEGATREQIMSAILTKEPRAPRRFNRRVPVDLETICLKAMEKDPEQRYASAGAMAEDLRRYLARELIAARRTSLARRLAKAVTRHPLAATIVIAAALLASSLGLAWSYKRAQEAAAARVAVSQATLDLREGLYRDGLAAVEQGLGIAPDLDTLQLLRATLLLKLFRPREAVEQAQALLAKDPDDWRAHLILASTAGSRVSGMHSPGLDAEQHARFVEAHAPETADVYFLRALLAQPTSEQLRLLDRALELDPAHAEALLERINRYHRVKDFPAALADCDRLLAVRPRSTQGRRMRAWTFYYQRDMQQARTEIDRAIEVDPDEPLNYWMRATLHDEAGRFKEALADLDRAVALAPTTARVLRERSGVRLELGDSDPAIDDARRAVELDPDDAPNHGQLLDVLWETERKDELRDAVATLRSKTASWKDETAQRRGLRDTALYAYYLGDKQAAFRDVEQVIAAAPTEVDGYRRRAGLYRRDRNEAAVQNDCALAASCPLELPGDFLSRGQWLNDFCREPDRAMEDLAHAMALAPSWAIPYRWRAVIHQRAGRFDEALVDLDRALELAPRWPDPYYNRGRVHAAMELFEPALADFRSFLGFGSDGMNVRWEQAKAFSRLGRWEEALAAIEAAERLQPKEALNLSRKGTVLLWAGRMPESVAAFTRGVDLDPSSALALQEKAYGAAYAGVPCPEVSADLAKSLELDPDEEWVAREVAWIHADVFARDCPAEFRPDLALELARRVVAGDATVPEFHETLGLVLYRRGSYEEARRALLEAVRLYSQPSASTLFTLAMTCQRLGRAAEARSFNDQAASRMQATYPNDPRLVRAMREASIVVDAR